MAAKGLRGLLAGVLCLAALWCGLVGATVLSYGQDGLREVYLEPVSSHPVHYPVLRRDEHRSGTVVLSYTITQNGSVVDIKVDSGDLELADAAIRSLGAWSFPPIASDGPRTQTTRFVFTSKSVPRARTEYWGRSWLEPGGVVQIYQEISPQGKLESGCPEGEVEAPTSSDNPDDAITLERYPCLGTCPGYSVTLHRDGRVSWNGKAYVKVKGQTEYRVDPQRASVALERFRSKVIWELCGRYYRHGADADGMKFNVRIGEKTKQVSVYSDTAPDWVPKFVEVVDDAANTHRMRHGPPETESLSNIAMEYLSKPGKTALMMAAQRGDVREMQALLFSGERVDAADASGWTALMYATAANQRQAMNVLISRGADVRRKSKRGDTLLMFASLSAYFDKTILEQTGGLNDQNDDGISALMILAGRGHSNPIALALQAGADVTLKDKRGYTARDYLEAKICERSLLFDTEDLQTLFGPSPCKDGQTPQVSDGLLRSRELLRKAKEGEVP